MSKDTDASRSATGLSQAEPEEVSALRASIPSADALQAQRSFLKDAARYFELRDTHGEDRAHWSNVFNAKNCREIAESLNQLQQEMARRDENERRNCLNWGPCTRMNRDGLDASAIEARQRPDHEDGLDPKGESAVAESETPKGEQP